MIVTLVIIVLVLINTLYVAAEFSAVSVRRASSPNSSARSETSSRPARM
jgi:CBS domain containing-hemolysin-like protein